MEKTLYAKFKTNEGDFTVELFADKAPITVGNFKKLADKKFYDGTIFHRIIKDFMIQGGDPEGTGFGGSDEMIPDEFAPGLRLRSRASWLWPMRVRIREAHNSLLR